MQICLVCVSVGLVWVGLVKAVTFFSQSLIESTCTHHNQTDQMNASESVR